ncbi:exodeoxyribonuclease X C-terminal domain-containing protein [Xanthobacter autotrophicus]|uniref:exodeoxyribonuclease X C-terminal domain-containing protein n=1 Tax=Xanthobacter autotrophicus TaxID=280 RepID=UPI00372B6225
MATILSLSSPMPFGKYKGLLVVDILSFNPEYIAWACNHVDWLDFDKEARKYGQQKLNERRGQSFQRQNAWAWGFGAGAKQASERQMLADIKCEQEARRKVTGRAALADHDGSER